MFAYLMSLSREEDKHILWDIYEKYRIDMYIVAKSIVHNDHLAEDVVQEAFEKIIKKMHLIEKVSCNGLRKYIILIVKSIAINTICKENRYKLEPNEDWKLMDEMDDLNLENMVIQNDEVCIIRKCLNEIDEKYSHPMIFRYYYGFTDSETAELLGINSSSTVRSLCCRGKKMIIKAMRKAGEYYE